MSYLDQLVKTNEGPKVQVTCQMSRSERDELDQLLESRGIRRPDFALAAIREARDRVLKG